MSESSKIEDKLINVDEEKLVTSSTSTNNDKNNININDLLVKLSTLASHTDSSSSSATVVTPATTTTTNINQDHQQLAVLETVLQKIQSTYELMITEKFDNFKTQKTELEDMKEKIQKLEQRNVELEKIISSNKTGSNNNSTNNSSMNNMSFNLNNIDTGGGGGGGGGGCCDDQQNINNNASINSFMSNNIIMPSSSLPQSSSSNTNLAYQSNSSSNLIIQNNSTNNLVVHNKVNFMPAASATSTTESPTTTSIVSNVLNAQQQPNCFNSLSNIPNISQGGYIVTSSGLVYIPPMLTSQATPTNTVLQASVTTPVTSTSSTTSPNSINQLIIESNKAAQFEKDLNLFLKNSTNDLPTHSNNNLYPSSTTTTTNNTITTTTSAVNNVLGAIHQPQQAFIISNGQLVPVMTTPPITSGAQVAASTNHHPVQILPQPLVNSGNTSSTKVLTNNNNIGASTQRKQATIKSKPSQLLLKPLTPMIAPTTTSTTTSNELIDFQNAQNLLFNETFNSTTMSINSQINGSLLKKHRAIRPKPSSSSTPITTTGTNAIKINSSNFHQHDSPSIQLAQTTVTVTTTDDILSKATSMILSPNEFLISPNNTINQVSPMKQQQQLIDTSSYLQISNNQKTSPQNVKSSIKSHQNSSKTAKLVPKKLDTFTTSSNKNPNTIASLTAAAAAKGTTTPVLQSQSQATTSFIINKTSPNISSQVFNISNFINTDSNLIDANGIQFDTQKLLESLTRFTNEDQNNNMNAIQNNVISTTTSNTDLTTKSEPLSATEQTNVKCNNNINSMDAQLLSFAQNFGINIENVNIVENMNLNSSNGKTNSKVTTSKGGQQLQKVKNERSKSPELASMPSLEQFFGIENFNGDHKHRSKESLKSSANKKYTKNAKPSNKNKQNVDQIGGGGGGDESKKETNGYIKTIHGKKQLLFDQTTATKSNGEIHLLNDNNNKNIINKSKAHLQMEKGLSKSSNNNPNDSKKLSKIKNKENDKNLGRSVTNNNAAQQLKLLEQTEFDNVDLEKVLNQVEPFKSMEQPHLLNLNNNANEENVVTIGDLSDDIEEEVVMEANISKNECINTPKSLNIVRVKASHVSTLALNDNFIACSDSGNESDDGFKLKNLILNKSATSTPGKPSKNKENNNNNKVKSGRLPLKTENKLQPSSLKKRGRPPKFKSNGEAGGEQMNTSTNNNNIDDNINDFMLNQQNDECDNNIENFLNISLSNDSKLIQSQGGYKKSRGRPKKLTADNILQAISSSSTCGVNQTELDEFLNENVNSINNNNKRKLDEKILKPKVSKKVSEKNSCENNNKITLTNNIDYDEQHITIASLATSPKRKRGRPSKPVLSPTSNAVVDDKLNENEEKIMISENELNENVGDSGDDDEDEDRDDEEEEEEEDGDSEDEEVANNNDDENEGERRRNASLSDISDSATTIAALTANEKPRKRGRPSKQPINSIFNNKKQKSSKKVNRKGRKTNKKSKEPHNKQRESTIEYAGLTRFEAPFAAKLQTNSLNLLVEEAHNNKLESNNENNDIKFDIKKSESPISAINFEGSISAPAQKPLTPPSVVNNYETVKAQESSELGNENTKINGEEANNENHLNDLINVTERNNQNSSETVLIANNDDRICNTTDLNDLNDMNANNHIDSLQQNNNNIEIHDGDDDADEEDGDENDEEDEEDDDEDEDDDDEDEDDEEDDYNAENQLNNVHTAETNFMNINSNNNNDHLLQANDISNAYKPNSSYHSLNNSYGSNSSTHNSPLLSGQQQQISLQPSHYAPNEMHHLQQQPALNEKGLNKVNSFHDSVAIPKTQQFNSSTIVTDYWNNNNNYSNNLPNAVVPSVTSSSSSSSSSSTSTNNVPSRHTTPAPALTPRPTSTSSINSLHQANAYSTHQQQQQLQYEADNEKSNHLKLKRNNSERYDQIPNNNDLQYHNSHSQIQSNSQNTSYYAHPNPFYAFQSPQLNFSQYPLPAISNNQMNSTAPTVPTGNRKVSKSHHEAPSTNSFTHSNNMLNALRNDQLVFDPLHHLQTANNYLNHSNANFPLKPTTATMPVLSTNVKTTNVEAASKPTRASTKSKKSTAAPLTRTSSNVNNQSIYDSLSSANLVPKLSEFSNSANNFLNPYYNENSYNKQAYAPSDFIFSQTQQAADRNLNSTYSQQSWNHARNNVHNSPHMANFPFFPSAPATSAAAISEHLTHSNHLQHYFPSNNHHNQQHSHQPSHQSHTDYVNSMKQFHTQNSTFALKNFYIF